VFRIECLRSSIFFACNPTGCILPTKEVGLGHFQRQRSAHEF